MLAIFVIALLAVAAWLARWEIVAVPFSGENGRAAMYMVNRWTGEVRYCQQFECFNAEYK